MKLLQSLLQKLMSKVSLGHLIKQQFKNNGISIWPK
jgi:hypothetical protein